MGKRGTTDIDEVRQLLASIPEVREQTLHGSVSFKLHGKILACEAIHHSAQAHSLVVSIDKARRSVLMASEPALYISDHYARYDVVLLRLADIRRAALRALLEESVRFVNTRSATKKQRSTTASGLKRKSDVTARRRITRSTP